MKKLIALVVVLLVIAGLGVGAYRLGWLAKLPISSLTGQISKTSGPEVSGASGAGLAARPGEAAPTPAGAPAVEATPVGTAAAEATASQPPASGTDAVGSPLIPPPAFDGNVAALDFGGTIEIGTGDRNDSADHQELIDGRRESVWFQSGKGNPRPGKVVLSFFAREPMLVDRIVLAPPRGAHDGLLKLFPKDVEVWISTGDSPDGPFQKAAAGSLAGVEEGGEASLAFSPVEARFLEFRPLNNQAGAQEFLASELKVMEAERPGYVPLLKRHPELQRPGGPNGGPLPAAPTSAAATCAPAGAPAPPGHAESRRVILLGEQRGMHLAGRMLEQFSLREGERKTGLRRVEFTLNEKDVAAVDNDVPADERGVMNRARFRFVSPTHARPALLGPAFGFDTVVLTQMCNGGNRMGALSKAFKQAMMAWVAAGHKLIIQDSDDCVPGPDYSFVPFRFKTDTPGARGAPGFNLRFVESNQMLQTRAGRPGFLDVKAWVNQERHYRNELGDANTFVSWDANWCGQLAVKNVNGVTGFSLAYARYGRGLIIYDGLDNDQTMKRGYDQVAVRELSQGFDPDNLPCAARLGDFVLTTETSLLHRGSVPGRTYSYPITLLSNLGYTGTVNLSASAVDAMTGLDTRFEPAAVELVGEGASALSVTLPGTLPAPSFAVQVKGTDAAGKNNSLCLQFEPATTGELAVVSTLAPPTKTRKNLEIILDASGSMKTPLAGKKSRWDVALETLDQALNALPDGFNVGLRMYGHREASTSPKTCTDSELLVPIRKLDRAALLKRAQSFKPKGETPLVYSALQAPADLKAAGGGTVILITDGEESCKGDMVKAAAELKASGLDIRLNIVGFALKNPKVQRDLAGFAESTGGLFYAAESGSTLADALMVAAVEKFPYAVYDSAGKVVVSGEAGAGSDQLPAGDYKVVVKAGARELVAPRVSVGLGRSVTLTIAMKNGKLVLQ